MAKLPMIKAVGNHKLQHLSLHLAPCRHCIFRERLLRLVFRVWCCGSLFTTVNTQTHAHVAQLGASRHPLHQSLEICLRSHRRPQLLQASEATLEDTDNPFGRDPSPGVLEVVVSVLEDE